MRPLLSWVALLISRPAWSTLSSKPLMAWKAAVATIQTEDKSSAKGGGPAHTHRFAGSILLHCMYMHGQAAAKIKFASAQKLPSRAVASGYACCLIDNRCSTGEQATHDNNAMGSAW